MKLPSKEKIIIITYEEFQKAKEASTELPPSLRYSHLDNILSNLMKPKLKKTSDLRGSSITIGNVKIKPTEGTGDFHYAYTICIKDKNGEYKDVYYGYGTDGRVNETNIGTLGFSDEVKKHLRDKQGEEILEYSSLLFEGSMSMQKQKDRDPDLVKYIDIIRDVLFLNPKKSLDDLIYEDVTHDINTALTTCNTNISKKIKVQDSDHFLAHIKLNDGTSVLDKVKCMPNVTKKNILEAESLLNSIRFSDVIEKEETVLNLLIQTYTLDSDSVLGLLHHIKKINPENGIKNAIDTVTNTGNFIANMDNELEKEFFTKIEYTTEIQKGDDKKEKLLDCINNYLTKIEIQQKSTVQGETERPKTPLEREQLKHEEPLSLFCMVNEDLIGKIIGHIEKLEKPNENITNMIKYLTETPNLDGLKEVISGHKDKIIAAFPFGTKKEDIKNLIKNIEQNFIRCERQV